MPSKTQAVDGAVQGWSILEALSLPVWVFDIDRQRVAWANSAALRVWNAASLDELCARDMKTDMSESVLQRLRQYQCDFENHGSRFAESWTLYPNGQPRSMQVVFSGIRVDGRMMMLCESQGELEADMTTLRSAEALLHTTVMITLYEACGPALYRNPAARARVADPAEGWRGHFVEESDWRELHRQVSTHGKGRLLARVFTREGVRWHEVSARFCRDAVSGVDALLFSEVDITSLKLAEDRAQLLATHDPLTGLPNRQFVGQEFQRQLERGRFQGQEVALMFIDLDRFKNVNDSLGHASGDALLVAVAGRLQRLLSPDDLIARLGGDEFLILVRAGDATRHARELADDILRELAQPVPLERMEVAVSASIGISVCDDHQLDLDALMRHADLAMYAAKDGGRNGMMFYTEALEARTQAQLSLENDIRRGLDKGEFVAYYQPRVCLETGAIIGAEALARWHHPQEGALPPSVFIGLCEESGLIRQLGRSILRQACRQLAAWQAQGSELMLSVNLSPRQFSDPHLLDIVRHELEASGCRADRLELEITESVLLGHDEATLATLAGLRQMGLSIAVDDFGTGYSNLAYLQHYPLSALKMDRSFVRELETRPAIAELITTLCHALKLQLVAEGVENVRQLAWLRAHGCQQYQGFLCSQPLPAGEFEALLQSWQGYAAELVGAD